MAEKYELKEFRELLRKAIGPDPGGICRSCRDHPPASE